MKLVVNTDTDILSLIFSEEPIRDFKLLEPDVVANYSADGSLCSLAVLSFSKFVTGKKPQAIEINLAPDHSDTHFEIDLPKPLEELLEEARQRSASKAQR